MYMTLLYTGMLVTLSYFLYRRLLHIYSNQKKIF